MILRSLFVPESGCASYVFACSSKGELGVVDPHADLHNEYLRIAAAARSRIVEVFDTHVHADHPSGARRLAEATGARLRLPEGAPVRFHFDPLYDRQRIEMGNTEVEVISTPGHAKQHACLLVTDHRRGDEPWLVFTGDTLLVGAVGRPDLHGSERELAGELWQSLHERLLVLPDWITIYPAHIGGSACGAGISSNPSSTIGFERRNNDLLNLMDRDVFVERVLEQLAPAPREFTSMYGRNRALDSDESQRRAGFG